MMLQVRTYDLVQKDKIFAIGYCFGGGAVLELMRSWPNTPGLLGEPPAPAISLTVTMARCHCTLARLRPLQRELITSASGARRQAPFRACQHHQQMMGIELCLEA